MQVFNKKGHNVKLLWEDEEEKVEDKMESGCGDDKEKDKEEMKEAKSKEKVKVNQGRKTFTKTSKDTYSGREEELSVRIMGNGHIGIYTTDGAELFLTPEEFETLIKLVKSGPRVKKVTRWNTLGD